MNKILIKMLRIKEGVWGKAYLYNIKYSGAKDNLNKREYLETIFPEV